MQKTRKSNRIGIIITTIILILLIVMTNINASKSSIPESILGKLIMPIQNGLVYLKNKIAGNTSFFENVEMLQEENNRLLEENKEMESQLRELEIIKAENSTLRKYVNMADQYSNYKTIPGYIIEKDISNLSDTFVINVGQNDGIQINMPVISEEGVVGYIISVADTTSKVKPIIDSSTSVSATLEITEENVIVKGILNSDDTLKVTYLSPETEITAGEILETSGIGGIYPKGLLIGEVKEVKETSNVIDRYAIVNTAVDFSKLDTVLVIIN